MLLSKTCVYGIRAAIYLATQNGRKFIPIREVSEKLDISFHFLTKILQPLTRNNLMISYRGPNGGIGLARPPEEITVYDIPEGLECSGFFDECILGLPGCGHLTPCPLHDKWAKGRDQIRSIFSKTDLGLLSRNMTELKLRLTVDDLSCIEEPNQ